MKVTIRAVILEEKQKLSDILADYIQELSKYKKFVSPYKYLDNYFEEANRHPLFIENGGTIVGFALVNTKDPLSEGKKHAISEFYIIPENRNMGIGSIAAKQVFDLFPGDWAIRELEGNPALKFWENVVSEYTKGDYYEEDQNDEKFKGKVQLFSNNWLDLAI